MIDEIDLRWPSPLCEESKEVLHFSFMKKEGPPDCLWSLALRNQAPPTVGLVSRGRQGHSSTYVASLVHERGASVARKREKRAATAAAASTPVRHRRTCCESVSKAPSQPASQPCWQSLLLLSPHLVAVDGGTTTSLTLEPKPNLSLTIYGQRVATAVSLSERKPCFERAIDERSGQCG